MRLIDHIVIHCSATPNGRSVSISEIDDWHAKRGFHRDPKWRALQQPQLKAVGYHFFITLDGIVTNGRHLDEVGAHVEGNNARSIGICMAGTDRFTSPQWASLRILVQSMRARYPTALVCGHRDYSPDRNGDGLIESWEWMKTCPGFDVKSWLARGMQPLPASVF